MPNPTALFETSLGHFTVELFVDKMPITAGNFVRLAREGFYDGIKFHRVIPNFMAQGGDPNTLDDDPQNDGQGGPGYSIACECYGKNVRRQIKNPAFSRVRTCSGFFVFRLQDYLEGDE